MDTEINKGPFFHSFNKLTTLCSRVSSLDQHCRAQKKLKLGPFQIQLKAE